MYDATKMKVSFFMNEEGQFFCIVHVPVYIPQNDLDIYK